MRYILRNKVPVKAVSMMDEWFEFESDFEKNKRIGRDEGDGWDVSTVFLSMDHNFSLSGLPVVFETLIRMKDSDDGEYITRYHHYEDAEAGHKMAVALMKTGVRIDDHATFYGIQTLYELLGGWFPLVEYELDAEAYLDYYRVDKLENCP